MYNKILKLFIFITLAVLLTGKSYAGLDREHNIASVVYYHGDRSQNKVALTFDDGPNEPYTSEIMDILKEYNVKATFFVLGKNVERSPDTLKRMVKEGHIIGNHTYDHPYLLIQSKAHVKYEIEKTEEAIFKAAGIKPHLFRPPYGLSSNWLYYAVQGWGYVSIEWSVTGNNGGKEIRPDAIEKDILSKVTNGAIILLHDGNRLVKGADRSHVVKALPVIIESLRAKGYQLVTVPELLDSKQSSLDKK